MSASRRKNIDEILTSPWVLWFLSIGAAVLMWVYVTGTEESNYVTRKFSCPLEYRAVDPQAMLRGRLFEVDIEIRGLEEAIARLDYNSITAFVDARNLTPGNRYTQNVNVDLPPNITLVSCVPSQVVLDLVRQVSRLMPVEVALPQDIPEGQYIEGVEVIPREVGVRGAEGDVARVGAIRVAPTIEELQSGKELLLPARFVQSEPFDGTVTLEPPQVRFKGVLVRGLPRKRVPVTVHLSGQLDGDYEIKSVLTDPSEVQIEGPADRLSEIEAVDTETVDISTVAEGLVSSQGDGTAEQAAPAMVVPLRLPEGVSLTGAKSVRLTLQLGEVKAERKLSNVPIELRGSEGGRWSPNPASVTVTLEGAPSKITAFSQEGAGLKAYVDLANIFMTPVTLPVRTEIVSDEFRVTRVEPQNVTVSSEGNPGAL